MIEMNDVSVVYDQDITALDHITVTLDRRVIGLVGENGSGKSTFLKSLVALEESTGEIRINGTLVENKTLREIRQRVGFLFQNPDHQLFMNDVRSDIGFGLKSMRVAPADIDRRVDIIASQLGITHLLARSPAKLSGGQKSLCALAGVLVMAPDILLLDEPTAFLDPKSRRMIINILKDVKQDIVLATHDLDLAYDLCDEIIIIRDGRLVAQGETERILHDRQLLEAHGLELPLRFQGV